MDAIPGIRIIEGWDEEYGQTRTNMDGYGQWQDCVRVYCTGSA
jgi:hypothetical protein